MYLFTYLSCYGHFEFKNDNRGMNSVETHAFKVRPNTSFWLDPRLDPQWLDQNMNRFLKTLVQDHFATYTYLSSRSLYIYSLHTLQISLYSLNV